MIKQLAPYTNTTVDSPVENAVVRAVRVVIGERNDDYGNPLFNHSVTAELWSAYLGAPITPEQVCMLNILQKISRSVTVITPDTLADIIGYTMNIEIIQETRPHGTGSANPQGHSGVPDLSTCRLSTSKQSTEGPPRQRLEDAAR